MMHLLWIWIWIFGNGKGIRKKWKLTIHLYFNHTLIDNKLVIKKYILLTL